MDPEKRTQPNVGNNPLPNYNNVPPRNVNVISKGVLNEREIFEDLARLNPGNEGVLEVLREMSVGMGSSTINVVDVWYDSDEEKVDVAQLLMESKLPNREACPSFDDLYKKELATITRSGRVYSSLDKNGNSYGMEREKSQDNMKEKNQGEE